MMMIKKMRMHISYWKHGHARGSSYCTLQKKTHRRLDEVRVQSSDSIDLMRANDGQMGHTNLLGLRLLDNGHTVQQSTIIGELLFDPLQEELNWCRVSLNPVQ